MPLGDGRKATPPAPVACQPFIPRTVGPVAIERGGEGVPKACSAVLLAAAVYRSPSAAAAMWAHTATAAAATTAGRSLARPRRRVVVGGGALVRYDKAAPQQWDRGQAAPRANNFAHVNFQGERLGNAGGGGSQPDHGAGVWE